MTLTLYRRLVSVKTLLGLVAATLSLYTMGTAFGQGVPAGTAAPVYGSTWAAAQTRFRDDDPTRFASEVSRTARADGSRTIDGGVKSSLHRVGG